MIFQSKEYAKCYRIWKLFDSFFSFLEKCSAGDTNKNCCSSSNKCDENQGDCDNDSDCKSGLKCGTDNCPAGFPDKSYDCCYKPKQGRHNL